MDGDRVAAWAMQRGGERASGSGAGADRRATHGAGLQVMAELAVTGGSKGHAPADTEPVIGFLVAGHPPGGARHLPGAGWFPGSAVNGQRRHFSLVATD